MVSLSAVLMDDRENQEWQPCPDFKWKFSTTTELQDLSITHTLCGDVEDVMERMAEMYIDLLAKSPKITRLSMNYYDWYDPDYYHRSPSYSVLRQISRLPNLIEIYWNISDDIVMNDFEHPTAFEGLNKTRRLVLQNDEWYVEVSFDNRKVFPY